MESNDKEVSEPVFFINYYDVGRGFINPKGTPANDYQAVIQKQNALEVWQIDGQNLVELPQNKSIFFDSESYTIKWRIELKTTSTVNEESVVYYWRGENAPKGFSPLPNDVDEHYPVERIWQWSETALFLHMFQANVFTVCRGNPENFNANHPHLFIILGELISEIHLFEVTLESRNLRNNASFLLVNPSNKCFYYWNGTKTTLTRKDLIQNRKPHLTLSNFEKSWTDFVVVQIDESSSEQIHIDFKSVLKENLESLKKKYDNFTPKLFYLNSITGEFAVTKIEYSLRSSGVVSVFPFTQTHLYSAVQPALFLLDNNTELWLWQGWKSVDYAPEIFKKDLEDSVEFIKKYAIQRKELLRSNVNIKHIYAGFEPQEFTNLFPVWTEKNVKDEAENI